MPNGLDLSDFQSAAVAANELIARQRLTGDADGIERLAGWMETLFIDAPLHRLTISELRMRVEHMRSLLSPN